MYKLLYFIVLIGLFYSNNFYAQNKIERESRIKGRDVPSRALRFIDSLNNRTKVKWYKDEELNKVRIEAKFKHNKLKYSIEFDTLGMIEDVEIEVDWEDDKSFITDSVTAQFERTCTSYKIVKVQKQFIGNEHELFSLLKGDMKLKRIQMNYEIVVKCNQEKDVNLFEYLFNDKGILLIKSKIVFKSSSHLEY